MATGQEALTRPRGVNFTGGVGSVGAKQSHYPFYHQFVNTA
jgi:hypothetical protein